MSMKKVTTKLLTLAMLLIYHIAAAQTDLQNTGILYVSGSSDILYISGSLTNASGSALTNNGNLYVLQNLSNGQSGMAVGTGTLLLNGSAVQTVSGAQLFKTFNLVTSNGTGFILNNDLSVSGVHTFTAGVITTSVTPNYLMYEAGSSYTGDADSRHVKGWVRKTGTTAFSFPVGNGTVERTIAVNNLSASSVFNATYAGVTTNTANLAAPLVTVDPYEYWIVNKVSGGTATVDMNWDYSKIVMPNYALADIRVASYVGGLWTQQGGSAAGNVTTTGTISSNALSTFGSLTFGSISFSLPVNLVQFSAYINNGNGVVNWTTSDEINVSHYDVQRSDDGISFYSIGNVAARNTTALQQYEFTDTKPLQTVTYYRLRSVDMDGKTKLSKIVTLSNNAVTGYMAIVNPAHSSIRVNAQHMNGLFTYRINTVAGQTIQQGSIKIAASGLYDIRLSSMIKTGLYVLQIEKTGFSYSQKVVIQ
jgi:hypothetical protein